MDILREPDRIQLISTEKTVFAEQQSDLKIQFRKTSEGINIAAYAESAAVSFIKLRWYGECKIGTQIFGDAFERAYGNLCFTNIVPERVMAWYCVESYNNVHTGYGVKVRPNALCFWQRDQYGITLWLDVRCGNSDFKFENTTLNLATLVSMQSDKPIFNFMQDFCKQMTDNPIFPDKPIYGFNNWYYAYGCSSEEEILEDAKCLVELTNGLENRPYMVIDDCWQLGSTNGQCTGTAGCITNYKFNDMKALADKIKEQNLKPGIWLRPLKFSPQSQSKNLALARSQEIMDPSLDEVLDIIAADVKKVTADWGYELIKYDFTSIDVFGKIFDSLDIDEVPPSHWSLKNNMTNAQCIKRLYKTIYDNSNGAIIIGCTCVSHLGCGYFHLHRSGDDTSGLVWERTRKYGINALAFRMAQHKAFYDIDADCVGILENNIDWKLNKQWLDLLANSGTPLFVSAQPKMIKGKIKDDLKEAFKKASLQTDVCYPQDLLYTTCPCTWNINGVDKTYEFIDTMGADKFHT